MSEGHSQGWMATAEGGEKILVARGWVRSKERSLQYSGMQSGADAALLDCGIGWRNNGVAARAH